MLERLSESTLRLMDILLGWLLRLPSDVQLCLLAIGSAAIITAVRARTTNQDLLRRCRDDKARLQVLMREAKARKDRPAVQRYRTTLGQIALKQFRQEGRPFLVSLLPIALLATWAFHRLEFHPPIVGETVEFTARFPISAAGRLVHIAPVDGVSAENGWLQEIVPVTGPGLAHSEAKWHLSDGTPALQTLAVRFAGQTYDHPLRVGAPTYEPTVRQHDEHLVATEVSLRPVKLFGCVPGLPALLFPPWLVAYLLIVIPSVPLLKRVFRVY